MLAARGYLSHQSGKWWEGNYADGGGAFYNDNSNATLTNCIIWGNTRDGLSNYQSTPTVNNSILQTPFGTTNVVIDPKFTNAADPDGVDNQWFTADDGLRLSCGSAAYNSGTNVSAPATDALGNARPQFSAVDMGAYESPFPTSAREVVASEVAVSPNPARTSSNAMVWAMA